LKRLFVGNLPTDSSEDAVRQLFSEFGTVRSIEIPSDIFTGKCKGFGFVEMEGHHARAALAELDGKLFCGKLLKVKFEQPKRGVKTKRPR